MELSKKDTTMTKGLAILFMVSLHLFCAKTNLNYHPLIYISDVPFAYYLGLFGDCCVVMYCFCSGYAHAVTFQHNTRPYVSILKRLPSFILRVWIIILFISLIGFFTGSPIPGSSKEFFLNFFMLKFTYNGAWWFITTYIYICLLSSVIYKIAQKNTALTLILFSAIYVVSYLYRFNKFSIPYPQNLFYDWLSNLGIFGTSLLPYTVGIVFYKHKIFTELHTLRTRIGNKLTYISVVFLFAAMFVLHMFFESLFFAIFTGIGTIVGFNIVPKSRLIEKAFVFFGKHSVNIWLTHMFFFIMPFENLAYMPKYSILCFPFTLILCIASSYIINFTYNSLKKISFLKKII